LGRIFVTDGSYDGLMTVVHGHYYEKWRPDDIVSGMFQRRLDAEYFDVSTDAVNAERVMAAISLKISPKTAETCFYAFLSEDVSALYAIYHFLILGFSIGEDVVNFSQNAHVLKTVATARAVFREATRLIELARFTETETGVFYADISPKYNCLPLLAEHFSDRFMNMAWVVHDTSRSRALIYDTNECIITDTPKDARVALSADEQRYRELWKSFFKAVTNGQRKNPKLQRSLLPLYYRKHVTEFK
jgi:probable DNA metabolism protein